MTSRCEKYIFAALRSSALTPPPPPGRPGAKHAAEVACVPRRGLLHPVEHVHGGRARHVRATALALTGPFSALSTKKTSSTVYHLSSTTRRDLAVRASLILKFVHELEKVVSSATVRVGGFRPNSISVSRKWRFKSTGWLGNEF